MLFLDGVYIERCNGSSRFRWVKAPTSWELTQLAHTIAHRVGRYLERQGLLERAVESSYLAGDAVDDDPMSQLCGHSITYRIGVGPQAGRKVFTLQTLPACDESIAQLRDLEAADVMPASARYCLPVPVTPTLLSISRFYLSPESVPS